MLIQYKNKQYTVLDFAAQEGLTNPILKAHHDDMALISYDNSVSSKEYGNFGRRWVGLRHFSDETRAAILEEWA